MFLFFTLLLFTFSIAQKSYFKKALNEGRKAGEFYKAEVSKSGVVLEEKLYTYASKKGYLLKNITFQSINRFGDNARGVKFFEFLPKTDIEQYNFESQVASGYTKPENFIQLKKSNTGAVYYFNPTSHKFEYLSNVYWTGSIQNGKINGEGVGYKHDNLNRYFIFKGKFIDGIPSKTCSFKTYYAKNKDDVAYGSHSKDEIFVAKHKDGLAAIKYNGEIGFVDKQMHIVIKPQYRKIIQEFENGKAILVNSNKEEVIIGKTGNFLNYTNNQKIAFIDGAKNIKQLSEKKSAFPDINYDYDSRALSMVESIDDLKFIHEITNNSTTIHKAKEKVDNILWEESLAKNDKDAYKYYFKNAPLGIKKDVANQKIAHINEQERIAEEKRLADEAKRREEERLARIENEKREERELKELQQKTLRLINDKEVIGHSGYYEITYTRSQFFGTINKEVNVVVKFVVTDVFGTITLESREALEEALNNLHFEVAIKDWGYANGGVLNINRLNSDSEIEYDLDKKIGTRAVLSFKEVVIHGLSDKK